MKFDIKIGFLHIAIFCFILISCSKSEANREITDFPFTSQKVKNLTKITFLNKTYNAGVISSDTVLTARYDFKNSGREPLIISSVLPDCGCTGYYLSNDTISVGESAYVLLTLSTRYKIGDITANATMITNTKTRFYNLALKATIKQY